MAPSGWNEADLASLLEKVIDYRGQSVPKAGSGIPLITARNVKDGYLDFSAAEFVDESEFDNWMNRGVPTKGDVLFTTEAPLGNACRFPEQGSFAIGQRTITLRPKRDTLDSEFLLYFLLSSRGQRLIDLRSSGSTAKGIKSSELKKLQVLYPTDVVEQRKIAKILSTWDEAIATTEQLLANSEQQKEALMQQLLTGNKRLPGFGEPGSGGFGRQSNPREWEFLAISNVATEVSERNLEQEDIPVLSCSKYDGFVDSLKYFKKKVYSDDTSNYKVIHRGQFGFPANHVEEGSIGLQGQYDKGIVSPIYVVFSVDESKVDNFFLYKVLKTDHYRQVFAAATSASVDRRGSLRWKPFSSLKISLPSLEEQQAISRVIKSAEREAKLIALELKQLKEEKKALMQQLLTGKRRVKVDEEQSDAVPA